MAVSLFRKDTWENLWVGLGFRKDKTKKTTFGTYPFLDDQMLSDMWLGDGLGKKICSVVADDMTKNWITISEDPDEIIMKELKRLKAKSTINLALKWMRLFRGSLIVMGINDGGELEEPVNQKSIRSIDWLKVFSAPRVPISEAILDKDPKSPNFGEVKIFKVNKKYGDDFKVHSSRCLIFKGEPAPDNLGNRLKVDNDYWGVSILQSIWTQMSNYGGANQAIGHLLFEAVIGKYKMDNLAQIISEESWDKLFNRMDAIDRCKSVINGVLLGEGEEYTRDALNFAGIPEIKQGFMMDLAGAAEIPATRLFGRSAEGMNATGKGDREDYYDMITSRQGSQLEDPLQYLVSLIGEYKNIRNLQIGFNPVWIPTHQEMIEMRNKQAQTDSTYINDEVLSPDEVRESRFAGGYSFDTVVDEEGGE